MTLSTRMLALTATLCVGTLTLESVAHAEWPMARRDARRSALAPGTAPIVAPQASWTQFLGGKLGWDQWLPSPIASVSGTPAVLALLSGNLETRRIDDGLIWATEGYKLDDLYGYYDLDGDGAGEVVASGRGPEGSFGAFVFDPNNGDLLWRTDVGIIGHIDGSVRIARMDDDETLDLFVVNANATEPGATPGVGFMYSFAAGYDQATQIGQLATQPPRDYTVNLYDAVGDFDGDGANDLFVMGRDLVYIYNLADGALKAASDDIGKTAAGRAKTLVDDLDGDGDDEVLMFPAGGWNATHNSVRVAMFNWDQATGKPVLAWERAAANFDTDKMTAAATSLVHVTDSTVKSVVVSFREAPATTYTLELLNAQTGAVTATFADAQLTATADLNGDGLAELYIRRLDKSHALLTHDGAGGLTVLHEMPENQLALCAQRPDEWRLVGDRQVCAVDSTAVTVKALPDGTNVASLVDYSTTSPTTIATLPSPENSRYLAFNFGTYPTLFGGQALAGVASNGRLLLFLPDSYAPLNYFPDGAQPVLGMRVRANDPGYGDLVGFPVAADLDADGREEIAVISSASEVLVFSDKTGAGPTLLWSAPDAGRLVIAKNAGEGAVLVAASTTTMRGYDAAGTELWEVDMTGGKSNILYGDIMVADIVGSAAEEILFQTRGSDGEQRLVAYAANGALVYDTVADINNLGMRRLALANLDGPESPAAIIGGTVISLWSFEAATGAPTVLSPTQIGKYTVVSDVDSDGFEELFMPNRQHFQFYDPGEGLAYTFGVPNTQPVIGGKATCAGANPGEVYVAATAFTGTMRAHLISDGTELWSRVLAGGAAYADDTAAEAAGAAPGALANTALVEHMPTATDGPAALVGSSDGFVYGVDACTGALIWSYALEAAVREVIPTDIDGDGALEVVAATADGQLHGIVETVVPSPTGVIDTDPPGGFTDVDVDDIETYDTLYAAWDVVSGVEYEVAVRTVDGTDVSGGFVAATAGNASLAGLPLQLGVRYEFGVRQLGDEGEASPVTWSDGVTVIDPSPPELTLATDATEIVAGTGSATLTWSATDKVGLANVALAIEDSSGALVKLLVELTVAGSLSEGSSVDWFAIDDEGLALAEGVYTARLTVADSAGNDAEATVEITVGQPVIEPAPEVGPEAGPEAEPDAEAEVEPEPEPEPGAEWGVEPVPDASAETVSADGGPSDLGGGDLVVDNIVPGTETGCDCRAGDSGAPQPGAILLVVALMAWLARRRWTAAV